MRLVLLGAPGSGKGTQASLISKRYNLPAISTGDIFRENIKNKTALGVKVKEIIDKRRKIISACIFFTSFVLQSHYIRDCVQ